MIVLLDTHYFIWALNGDRRLTGRALDLIADPGQPVAVSIVSLWEMAIKSSLGKLELKGGVEGVVSKLPEMGFDLLGLREVHVTMVATLPLHHRDPFDRMLIAQAQAEGLVLVTADEDFRPYGIRVRQAQQ